MADLRREFEGRRQWNLWNGPTLASVSQDAIVFWDDPAIPEDKKARIKWYCGVEVHQLILVVGLYGVCDGTVFLGPIQRVEYTEKGLGTFAEQVAPFHPVRFVMETTGIYHYSVVWFLNTTFPASPAIVMNARAVAKLMQRTKKSDPIDAARLAQLARYDELLRPSYVPSPHQAILRDYSRQRAKAVGATTRLKNHIKKILGMYGCHLKWNFQLKWHVDLLRAFLQARGSLQDFLESGEAQAWKEKADTNPGLFAPWGGFDPSYAVRQLVLFLWQRLAMAECDVIAVEHTIQKVFQEDEAMKSFCTLINEAPGIKDYSTIGLIAEIGTIKRFSSEAHFLSYAGIGPCGGTSGIKVIGDREEKIVAADQPNRRCNPRVKQILVRAAKTICTLAKNGPYTDDIVRYAKGLFPRNLKYFPLLFKIAAKLGRRIYYCLNHQVPYLHRVVRSTAEPGGPKKSRRIKATRKKFILEQRVHQIWGNAERVFAGLTQLQVPEWEISRLRELFYLGSPNPNQPAEGGVSQR